MGSGTMSRSLVARTKPCTPTATPPITTNRTCAPLSASSRSSGSNIVRHAFAQLAHEPAETQRLLQALLRGHLAVAPRANLTCALLSCALRAGPLRRTVFSHSAMVAVRSGFGVARRGPRAVPARLPWARRARPSLDPGLSPPSWVACPIVPVPVPPAIGLPLPRAADARAAPKKLAWLLAEHGPGREWARVLRVPDHDSARLWGAIARALIDAPVSSIRDLSPFGIVCEVRLVLTLNARTSPVLTAWHYANPGDPPRLVTAYPTP